MRILLNWERLEINLLSWLVVCERFLVWGFCFVLWVGASLGMFVRILRSCVVMFEVNLMIGARLLLGGGTVEGVIGVFFVAFMVVYMVVSLWVYALFCCWVVFNF